MNGEGRRILHLRERDDGADVLDAGQPITMFGDGTSSRDYTYVSDIVRGLRSAAEALGPPGSCREWNLGRGEPIALAELIGLIFIKITHVINQII